MKLIKCKETSDSAQILLAIELLKEATENLQIDIRSPPNTFSVLSLQGVAAIRAAFDVLSSYLGKDCLENIKKHENFSNYLEVSKNLCIASNQSPVRLFLLKQLVRKYGIDAVKDRCRNEWLSWILPVENQVECFHTKKKDIIRLYCQLL